MLGQNCCSTCTTKDHPNFGVCMRAKGVRTLYVAKTNGCDADHVKKFDAEIAAYRAADRQGVQPDGSQMHQIDRAMRISEATGTAYQSTV